MKSKGVSVEMWDDLPRWEGKITLQSDSDEGKALLGTSQGKSIFWVLLTHRQALGKKTIKKICVFLDDITGQHEEYPSEDLRPSMYPELEDFQ